MTAIQSDPPSQPFRFLDLPTELRFMVYEQIPINIQHTVLELSRLLRRRQHPESTREPTVTLVSYSASLPLLQTCRTIQSEATPFLERKVEALGEEPIRFIVDLDDANYSFPALNIAIGCLRWAKRLVNQEDTEIRDMATALLNDLNDPLERRLRADSADPQILESFLTFFAHHLAEKIGYLRSREIQQQFPEFEIAITLHPSNWGPPDLAFCILGLHDYCFQKQIRCGVMTKGAWIEKDMVSVGNLRRDIRREIDRGKPWIHALRELDGEEWTRNWGGKDA
ncbi:hypothetical protein BU26DRAFT_233883 [Trematosphaeria pertusa]|uniref:F-box domain-containing protein n=1 Tax=Trematosphaeria pertusa TaxID=390896 RepID=A0A6A6IWL5_9PLEO|nr:uncharacterized protein BU26DRAFT_233883 [Trematosphaeria pertusa]KAF2254010.1 hypothetical protein BU26DRAFT_233883 [Trematosphaeria pertusa]